MSANQETMTDDTPGDGPFGQLSKKCDWSGLDHVGQKIAKALRAMLRERGVEDPRPEYGGHDQTVFSEWSGQRRDTDILARLRFAPLKGTVGLVLPGSLIAQLVDIHYGGDGRTASAKPELSGAERRYVEKLLAELAAMIGRQWQEVHTLDVSFIGLENAPSRLRVARSDEEVIVQQWDIGAGNLTTAKISLVHAVDPMRKLAPMLGGFGTVETENVDESWRRGLRDAAMNVQLPVRTIFARPPIAFDKLMSLKKGDIIPITLPKRVPVSVSGMLFAYGSVGESDGHTAIRIESIEKGYEDYE